MPRPDDIFPFTDGAGRALLRQAAIRAAHDTGLARALRHAGDGGSVDDFAKQMGVKPRRLRALLDVLAVERLVERSGPHYRADRPLPAAGTVPPDGWGLIAASIQTDTARAAARMSGDELARYHAHLFQAGAGAAAEVAGRLARPGSHVLDAGGGSGAYAAAWLNAHPTTRATLVDLPDVVALARTALASFGSRVTFIEGDLADRWPGSAFDVGLLANVLHLHGAATCRRIIARVFAAIAPGGTIAVKDFRIDAERRAPEVSVLFALNMAIYTKDGDVHPPDDIAAWLKDAGAASVREMRLASSPDAMLMLGERPIDRE